MDLQKNLEVMRREIAKLGSEVAKDTSSTATEANALVVDVRAALDKVLDLNPNMVKGCKDGGIEVTMKLSLDKIEEVMRRALENGESPSLVDLLTLSLEGEQEVEEEKAPISTIQRVKNQKEELRKRLGVAA